MLPAGPVGSCCATNGNQLNGTARHHRAQDRFVSFSAGERLRLDLPPFEELNQANALDVVTRERPLAVRTEELERSPMAHALDRLPGGRAELLGGQLRSGVLFHGGSPRV
jgi:hypothetical protein